MEHDRPSQEALSALTALVVLSPWAFGGVHPLMTQAIAVLALLTSLVGLTLRRTRLELPRRVALPLLGLWLLAALQLTLLPGGLHRWLAPGSSAVWYPGDPVAAAVLGGGSHPISVDPESTAHWLAFTTGLVALALLASPALRERRVALRASVALIAGAIAVAVYGLVARLAFGDKLYGFLAVPTVAPFGPFVSKNHFAGYVEMAACLAVGLAAGLADEARRGPERLSWLDSPHACRVVFAWGAAAVLVLAVPLSLSRGGVVSLTGGLVTFVAVRMGTRPSRGGLGRSLAVAASVLALAISSVVFVLPQEATARVRTLGNISADNSGSYRIAIWRNSLRLAASSPLVGSGFGAYEDAIPRFKTVAGDLSVEHAENDYVELLAEGGLAGVSLAGFLLLVGVSDAFKHARDEEHRLSRGLRAGALAAIAALLVHSAFDFNLRIPSNALLFVLLVALAFAPVDRTASESPSRPSGARGWIWIAGVVILSLTAILAVSTPWTGRRLDRASFERAAYGGGLRGLSLERDTIAHLRRRPADAAAWVGLAWLRRWRSPAEARVLARWGTGLDPQYEALRRLARDLGTPPAGDASGQHPSEPAAQP
jgi:O-antigen ligase